MKVFVLRNPLLLRGRLSGWRGPHGGWVAEWMRALGWDGADLQGGGPVWDALECLLFAVTGAHLACLDLTSGK